MAKSPKQALAPKANILVAVGELVGGIVLSDGEELTAGKQKELGLDDEAVADLIERGKLLSLSVRQTEASGDGEVAALREKLALTESDARRLDGEAVDLRNERDQLKADLEAANAKLAEAAKTSA